MSIGALDPVLASALARTRQTAAAAETAPDATATETSDAKSTETAKAVAGTGMTGSTTAAVSPDTQGAVLNLKDMRSISITEIRKRLFDAYDTDKNGTVDDSEYQRYTDINSKFATGDAKPLDFRGYDPTKVSQQKYEFDSITVLPYQAPAPAPAPDPAPDSGTKA